MIGVHVSVKHPHLDGNRAASPKWWQVAHAHVGYASIVQLSGCPLGKGCGT